MSASPKNGNPLIKNNGPSLTIKRFIGEFSLAEGHTLVATEDTDKGKAWCCGEYCLFISLLKKRSLI